MNGIRQGAGVSGFLRALAAGLQWRLLLIWLLLMLIPAAIATWPMGAALGALLDHSAHSQAWAESFSGLAVGDAMLQLGRHSMPAISASAMAGALVALMLSPFLTGMVVTSAQSASRAGFGELMHGGLHQYWRMLRVWLWAIPLWAIALGIGSWVMHLAEEHASMAVLQSDADLWNDIALGVMVLLLVIAHTIVESARAQFGADAGLHSATRAVGRALKMVLTRPFATFGVYLVVSAIGYLLVLSFGMLRMRNPAVGALGMLAAFALTQLVVLSLAWMRIARLHGLANLPRKRRGGASLSLSPLQG